MAVLVNIQNVILRDILKEKPHFQNSAQNSNKINAGNLRQILSYQQLFTNIVHIAHFTQILPLCLPPPPPPQWADQINLCKSKHMLRNTSKSRTEDFTFIQIYSTVAYCKIQVFDSLYNFK